MVFSLRFSVVDWLSALSRWARVVRTGLGLRLIVLSVVGIRSEWLEE
jgi:hypothetical protein